LNRTANLFITTPSFIARREGVHRHRAPTLSPAILAKWPIAICGRPTSVCAARWYQLEQRAARDQRRRALAPQLRTRPQRVELRGGALASAAREREHQRVGRLHERAALARP